MADHVVPHFHNDPGVSVIEIGAKEFMCTGARPPFGHPRIFCDMGDENEIICWHISGVILPGNAAINAPPPFSAH